MTLMSANNFFDITVVIFLKLMQPVKILKTLKTLSPLPLFVPNKNAFDAISVVLFTYNFKKIKGAAHKIVRLTIVNEALFSRTKLPNFLLITHFETFYYLKKCVSGKNIYLFQTPCACNAMQKDEVVLNFRRRINGEGQVNNPCCQGLYIRIADIYSIWKLYGIHIVLQ